MSLARRVLEHATYMITRRCSERRYFLRPDRKVTRLIEYLVGVLAKRFEIQVIAACFLGNHYHVILVDPVGQVPKFMQELNSLLARALNAHWGRGENLWAPGSYNSVEIDPIHDEQTLLEKLAYLWCNPVAAGLVERPESWPGLLTLPEDMGRLQRYRERPDDAFFGGKLPPGWEATYEPRRERLDRLTRRSRPRRAAQPKRAEYQAKPSTLPEGSTLEVVVPPHVTDPDDFRRRCRELLDARLEEVYAARRTEGLIAYLGRDRILAQDPFGAPGDTIPDFGLDPALAPGSDTEERIEKIQELQVWREEYASALRRWCDGDRAVRFPRGTYRLRVLHAAQVVVGALLDAA